MLQVRNICVRYQNGALGIIDVSFAVQPGQIVALFGGNGAGKTTSVRAVSGFLRTEHTRVIRGAITLEGRNVTNWEPQRVSKLGVSLVPEREKVFPNLTVHDNLEALDHRLPAAVRRELLDRVHALFPTLLERRRELAGRLSGGQQQMLAIARSVLSRPRYLLLDELTLGLHRSVQPALFDAVARIAADGAGVILVDESAALTLERASYCYLLRNGHVIDEGPAERFRGNELLAAGYVE
jgi:branched-chain amino acid transport system ATP-binding protein